MLQLAGAQSDLGEKEIERLLVLVMDSEVDINCANEHGQTPLLLLCLDNSYSSFDRCIRGLLQRRSLDVQVTDMDGDTACDILSNSGFGRDSEIIQMITKFEDIGSR